MRSVEIGLSDIGRSRADSHCPGSKRIKPNQPTNQPTNQINNQRADVGDVGGVRGDVRGGRGGRGLLRRSRGRHGDVMHRAQHRVACANTNCEERGIWHMRHVRGGMATRNSAVEIKSKPKSLIPPRPALFPAATQRSARSALKPQIGHSIKLQAPISPRYACGPISACMHITP